MVRVGKCHRWWWESGGFGGFEFPDFGLENLIFNEIAGHGIEILNNGDGNVVDCVPGMSSFASSDLGDVLCVSQDTVRIKQCEHQIARFSECLQQVFY